MTRWRLGTAITTLGLHVTATSVLAQQPTRLPGEEGLLLTWAIAAGIVTICCLASFLNPKRSHLT